MYRIQDATRYDQHSTCNHSLDSVANALYLGGTLDFAMAGASLVTGLLHYNHIPCLHSAFYGNGASLQHWPTYLLMISTGCMLNSDYGDHIWLHPEYHTWFHLNIDYNTTLWLHGEYWLQAEYWLHLQHVHQRSWKLTSTQTGNRKLTLCSLSGVI